MFGVNPLHVGLDHSLVSPLSSEARVYALPDDLRERVEGIDSLMRIIGPYVSPGKILLANSLRLLPLHCVERAGVRPPPLHRYGESSPTVSGKMETPRSPAVPRHRAPLNRLSEEQPLISLPGGVGFGSRQLELRDTGTPVDNGHPAESEGD